MTPRASSGVSGSESSGLGTRSVLTADGVDGIEKDFDIGVAEGIDRLFWVADDGNVSALAKIRGQAPHEFQLTFIGILILIDHEEPKLRRKFFSHARVVQQAFEIFD